MINWFDIYYLFRKTPWDTNITPPEIVALVEGGRIAPCRALDLGCGTGTNVLYLWRHGFDAVGIDFSHLAIRRAQAKARAVHSPARFFRADLLESDSLPVYGSFDFVFDIGVMHIWDAPRRARYAETVARLTRPGSWHYTFGMKPRVARRRSWWRGEHGPVGITAHDVRRALEPHGFALVEAHDAGITPEGISRTGWYLSRRER